MSLQIYDCLDLGRRIDVVWPSEEMRASGGRSSWQDWSPHVGMVGYVVHYWTPNHPDSQHRSNVNRTLLLLKIGKHYVPVGENGVKEYNFPSSSVAGQAVSAENLARLSKRNRSKGKKSTESIRKLKSEEGPSVVMIDERHAAQHLGNKKDLDVEGSHEKCVADREDAIEDQPREEHEERSGEGTKEEVEEVEEEEATTQTTDAMMVRVKE